MKLILDTSVLVSGIFFGGVPSQILTNATIVNATPLPTPVSVDPADDVFLAAATSSGFSARDLI
ncbi:MAG: hypothetical protein M3466_01550 [Gemmatimonadota bacterium]|nr:hypothetical protein [Gemmatimonadota bacterium]